ncbi:flavodoxin family protein [Chryseobacterium sediminis]|uniref:Flavodoxin n=1 Tax=Chryseobacterium sediminis TaxID=1679494 RepID=A0A5B2U8Z1_9FLAO|nr:flavodoxin [Chryseobacterium sediminis]KAA2222883.1 flavodoxin [Chryseobacterium sediminis]
MEKLKNFGVWFCAVLLLLSSCSKAQKSMSEKKEMLKDKNVLIVYLSRTKNTKTIADIIHQNTGGTLIELELQNPYPEDYKAIVDQVAKENDTNFLPPLKTKIDDIEKYDVIFLGFPTWGMQLPPPMKSFLGQNNFKGKTIILFNTNAGYGIGNSFDTVKKLSPGSTILEDFTIKGGVERDGILFVMEGKKKIEAEKKVKEWLTRIGMSK